MPFDTALSGIRAASSELSITGNNIANASTTGFKSSRAEFGDVYATSVLGAGANQVGAGVEIQKTAQSFTQGNITFTENELDLAINGNGFFILSNDGDRTYTRSGTFKLNAEGYIVSNSGSRLQGYAADDGGNVDSVMSDLQISRTIIDPRLTTNVDQRLNMNATEEVLSTSGRQFSSTGPVVGVATAGTANGYPAQAIDITAPDGNVLTYTSMPDDSAAAIASEMNSILGITASATNQVTLSNFNNVTNPMTVTINNVDLTASDLTELETQINQRTNSTLPGLSATIDPITGNLSISSAVGADIRVAVAGDPGAGLDMQGLSGGALALQVGGAQTEGIVGGQLNVTVEDGYAVSNETPSGTGLFQALGDFNDPANPEFAEVTLNAFDPTDPRTYNSATSTTIYDSFGVSHVMTQFFVKQPFDATDPTSSPNHWVMHVQVDGQDVGDPDPADPTVPTPASYNIYFNEDGSLNNLLTEDILISNWTPLDDNGVPNNSLGPLPVIQGGGLPLPEPPTSSNFIIDIAGSTQFGAPFAVNSVYQDGYSAGQLSGLSIDETGIIFARFTNGQSLAQGQVLLADFANQQGLQAVGDTSWAETFESGTVTINEPGTAALGAIQSGALEESNVDLSEQLVQLIISQRNFQASAKTIETADQTTQTIINLR